VTPWVLRIIFANAAVYLLEQVFGSGAMVYYFGLVPALAWMRPWTLVTYMFLHGGLGHIFFNMLVLFFFGPMIEARLGGKSFLWLYFVSGITGGLLSIVFSAFGGAMVPIIGASGAVFGVELAFAYYWPRQPIYIWGLIPIQARWLVLIMTAVSLYGGFVSTGGGIAHFAHLGGFLGGFLYLKWMERRQGGPLRDWRAAARPVRAAKTENMAQSLARWSRIKRDNLHEVNRGELDRILDKISASGIGSLTPSEREFLDRFSARS